MRQERFEITLRDFLDFRICTVSSGERCVVKAYQRVDELPGFIITETRGGSGIQKISSDRVRELAVLNRIVYPEELFFKGRKLRHFNPQLLGPVAETIRRFRSGRLLIRKVASAIQMLHLPHGIARSGQGRLVLLDEGFTFWQNLDSFSTAKVLLNYIPNGRTANRLTKTSLSPRTLVMLSSMDLEKFILVEKYRTLSLDFDAGILMMIDKAGLLKKVVLKNQVVL